MQYDIMVQGQLYKTVAGVDGADVSEIFRMISNDIASGALVVNGDQPLNLVIKPRA